MNNHNWKFFSGKDLSMDTKPTSTLLPLYFKFIQYTYSTLYCSSVLHYINIKLYIIIKVKEWVGPGYGVSREINKYELCECSGSQRDQIAPDPQTLQ